MAGKTKNYTKDFKKQIVALKKGGKKDAELEKTEFAFNRRFGFRGIKVRII